MYLDFESLDLKFNSVKHHYEHISWLNAASMAKQSIRYLGAAVACQKKITVLALYMLQVCVDF